MYKTNLAVLCLLILSLSSCKNTQNRIQPITQKLLKRHLKRVKRVFYWFILLG